MNIEAPGIEEQYVSACHTSNLRVEADRKGAGDVLIAAGWSPGLIGGALLRLHSEWDGAAHPKQPTKEQINLLALTYSTDAQGKPSRKQRGEMAKAQAMGWYVHELELLMSKLKSLPRVRIETIARAKTWGIEHAEAVVPAVIGWWLQHACPTCSGTAHQVIEEAGQNSVKACRMCQGSGSLPVPHSKDGRIVASFLDECAQVKRQSIAAFVRNGNGHLLARSK